MYRLLILAQCHALCEPLGFLFERDGDGFADFLLPDNLLLSNSILRKLVDEIEEDDWQEVEVIGWLYQFFISERKDEVIGKVVKSADIPAATQLFTPNWIVKYMVQNSLGAQWLAAYPDSGIRAKMDYYIEPAEQTAEVQAELETLRPQNLQPEDITFLDPACGSGHILVEAFDLLFEIYKERGYQERKIPGLILQHNLYGLDIDKRAAQMAGFALMMEARKFDRRVFTRGVTIHVHEILESNDPRLEGLQLGTINREDVKELLDTFTEAKTYGSLICLPASLQLKLPSLREQLAANEEGGGLFVDDAVKKLLPFLQVAEVLARKYDCVVANPPYMGGKYLNPKLKTYLKENFKGVEKDLFSAYIVCNLSRTNETGQLGFMSPFVWMFISSYEELRKILIDKHLITTLIQLEYSGFSEATVPICTFTLAKRHIPDFTSSFVKLSDFKGAENQAPKTLEAIRDKTCGWFHTAKPDDFKKIPGSPIAYWVSERTRQIFAEGEELGDCTPVRQGLATADNDRFLRSWSEVSFAKCGYGLTSRDLAVASHKKWFPYNKGGDFRKWYGNNEFLVNWEDDGRAVRVFGTESGGRARSRAQNTEFYFLPSVTWSFVSSAYFGVRYSDAGAVFDVGGSSAFPSELDHLWVTGFLCSKQVFGFMKVMNPTLNFQVGNVVSLPVLHQRLRDQKGQIEGVVEILIESTRIDWNAYERSWDFQSLPLLGIRDEGLGGSGGEGVAGAREQGVDDRDNNPSPLAPNPSSLESSYAAWIAHNRETIAEMKRLEEENNRLFIDAYGLADELTPDVPIEQITLTVNPAYRYSGKGGKLTEEEQWSRFQEDTVQELLSYAIGCMMGRYSLDIPGLVMASQNETLEDYSLKHNEVLQWGIRTDEHADPDDLLEATKDKCSFLPDEDGIIPLTDLPWFEGDATERIVEFIRVAWATEYLEENLKWIADSLGTKQNETPRDTIRRYLSQSFYKFHCKTYKKRPIYWLFSSGRNKAFEALVYLHRYNESTLSRLRSEYVVPLMSKFTARLEHLAQEVGVASTTASRNRAQRELDALKKKQKELQLFDEELRHYADQRIPLDLDDGVKVNYQKFGTLLAKI